MGPSSNVRLITEAADLLIDLMDLMDLTDLMHVEYI